MSESLETRVEIQKIEHLLGVESGYVKYLEQVSAVDLRILRQQVTDVLFDVDAAELHTLGSLGRALPPQLIAAITQQAVSPLLTARIAGMVDTKQAIHVAQRLPTEFLADVAIELDPRRASDVIGNLDEDTVTAVTAELAEREEYITMGSFVGHMDEALLAPTFNVISNEGLLRTAFVMEDKERLDVVAALLPDERLLGVLREASTADLWPEALDLIKHLGAQQLARIAAIAADEADELLTNLIDATAEHGLWEVVLPMIELMEPEDRARLAKLPVVQKKNVLTNVVQIVAKKGLWSQLVPLYSQLPARSRHTVSSIVGDLSPQVIDRALVVATKRKLWRDFVAIVADMVDPAPVANALLRADPKQLDQLLKAVERDELWPLMNQLLDRLPSATRRELGKRAKQLGKLDRLEPIAANLR